ncbi:MAG TPA: hypothetical protein VFD58_16170 [Blastocatellia bacterium]|nr:hypothetical protein [Blastocatellia bacterium]
MLTGLLLLALLTQSAQSSPSPASPGAALRKARAPSTAPVTRLEFSEFFEPATSELKPSVKLLSLDGKRARLTGFMAQMEDPPEGAFYLCPRPVACDESGGGSGDLPVESVRVIVRSAKGRRIDFIPRAIEVTGILRVGRQNDDPGDVSGHVSLIRLILDGPGGRPRPARQDSRHRKKNGAVIQAKNKKEK